ncbi:MAG: HAD family hydrolase [Proteobacteria bacterium]|nr:HAD family hydrolase [Pseudomonadota bacterium]
MSEKIKKIKVISFDLDGTLVDIVYTMWVWERGLPELYAKKNSVSISEAIASVTGEYARVSDASLKWYDIAYWFNFFDLSGDWKDLMEKHREKICLFPEVKEIIEELTEDYELVITSNAAREFVEIELQVTGIEDYFSRIFSATSDFRQVKKTSQFYKKLCKTIGISPSQMIHIGDHYEFDYLAPQQAGIETYYLDRDGKTPKNSHTVKNLKEFVRILRYSQTKR